MGAFNILRRQSLIWVPNRCAKNLTTKATQVKSGATNKVWGLGGTLVAAGLVGAFSSCIKLEAESPISFKEDTQKLTEFIPQTMTLQINQGELSRKNPGIFLWGTNGCGIAAPDKIQEASIKLPRKLECFEGQAFRGLAFALNHAVAIDANGDLYQWGSGYFGEEFEKSPVPELTLKGKDIAQVAASDKKVFALSRRGELYVISSSKKYQGVPKENQAQSWSEYLWGVSPPSINFFKVEIPNASRGEKIKHISAGQHHLAAITSNNRILTLQADAEGKKYGQLGVGNLDSATVPTNHFDNAADFNLQFNEVELPDSVTLDKVACGSNHTLIRTSSGRIFAFGANFSGQLGIGDFTLSKAISAIPQEITSYFGGSNNQFRPKILDIAAGGDTSAFVVHQLDFDNNVQKAELYTCGFGQWGQLGNNRYMHAQGVPVKVQAFSSKFEYSEELKQLVPVNLYKLSIGATHVFATLNNEKGASEFGRDVYTWGQNANFQLGTGKRNNLCAPAPPLLPNYSQTDGPSDPNVLESLQGRLQVASPAQVTIAFPKNKTKQALVEQEIVAGFGVSALYSKIIL